MIKEHISSGGITIRMKNNIPYFLMVQKMKVGWVMPKGHAELGETPETAAKREVKEEAGLDVASLIVLTKLGEIGYSFEKDGVQNKKAVHIFLIHDTSNMKPNPLTAEDFEGVEYFPYEQIMKNAAYENEKEYYVKAKQYLDEHPITE